VQAGNGEADAQNYDEDTGSVRRSFGSGLVSYMCGTSSLSFTSGWASTLSFRRAWWRAELGRELIVIGKKGRGCWPGSFYRCMAMRGS
jgi:hypothetical protein